MSLYSDQERAELEEKYHDFLTEAGYGKEKLILRMLEFEAKSAVKKRILTRNFHRRAKVYYSILAHLNESPQRFTDLCKSIGGSRSTISSCIKGLRESKIAQQNIQTRKYELTESGLQLLDQKRRFGFITGLSRIATPSLIYGTRAVQKKTKQGSLVSTDEKYVVKFYPRRGFVRIDESKPKVKAALAALLDPVYCSIRNPLKTDFEIEINLKVRGSISVAPTPHQRAVEEYKEKEAMWFADARRRY
jgi:predicted transcriptional regulator